MCESHHRDTDAVTGVSRSFHAFVRESPDHADAWQEMTHRLEHASALEPRTLHLAYLAVLAAMDLENAIPLHVELARDAGATRAEIASAVLAGLPAAGSRVIGSLPVALAAFDRADGAGTATVDALEVLQPAGRP